LKEKLPSYGGQAIIEGVMMRGQSSYSIAVRAPDQSIIIENHPLSRIYRSKFTKIPFLRGLITLWDALVLGMTALTFSANAQASEDEKIEGAPMVITLILSLVGGIGLFFLLPAGIVYLAEVGLAWEGPILGIVEGIIRLGLLIGYIWSIGRIPEIQRVFGYHGAEHKTINAFEAGGNLDVDTVATFSREHPRCGTAFLLTVVIISILVFTIIGPLPIGPRLVSRFLLVPLIAMLAYEYMRFTASRIQSPWIRHLVSANMALQRLTTREPDREMLEIAIAAFNSMLHEEQIR
jgi:uncharacterized protein YqhQ